MSRKWVALSCFILVLLLVPLSAALAQTTNTVRAVWNATTLVLINISSEGVDVSELSLEGESGEILPTTWAVKTDAAGVSYSLTDVRPGSCLVVSLSGTTPEIPANVTCSRIVADITLEDINDVVWDVSKGGFTPVLAGVGGSQCDVSGGTSCDIAVNPANTNTSFGQVPENVDVRAIWNNDILVIINTSDYGADLSDLILNGSTGGAIEPRNWVMGINPDTTASYTLRNMRPGSCLVSYLSVQATEDEAPDLPEGVDCTRIAGEFTAVNLDDLVWTLDAGGFTPSVDGVQGTACEIVDTTTCDITVPNADLGGEVEEDAAPEAGAKVVRALWNNDILVLINVSDDGVDLSGLSLLGVDNNGAIFPENWVMAINPATTASFSLSDVRPGSCLISYLSVAGTDNTAPALPAGVTCDEVIGEFTPINLSDLVWTLESNGFIPVLNNVEGEPCEIIGSSSCDITLN
jgi:hypothetical protein